MRLLSRCRSRLLTFPAPDSHYAFYSCHGITCQKGKFIGPSGIAREIGSVLQQCAVHLVHEHCPGSKFAFGEFLGCGAASGQLLFYNFLSGRLVFSQLLLRPLLGGKLSDFSFHGSPRRNMPVWAASLSLWLELVLDIASICHKQREVRTVDFSWQRGRQLAPLCAIVFNLYLIYQCERSFFVLERNTKPILNNQAYLSASYCRLHLVARAW